MKPKEYEITSFERLCNVVNKDNAENLATDLALWLIYYANCLHGIREKNPELTKGKLNTEIAKGTFTWIDDGKNELRSSTIVNKATGEITKIGDTE